MASNQENNDFQRFISLFPEIELPVSLSSEYVEIFSKANKPIPEILIRKYIEGQEIYIPENIDSSYNPFEKNKKDSKSHINLQEIELTPALDEKKENEDSNEVEDEYIACLKLPDTNKFIAVVYLKIGILTYEYFLHTFDFNGKTIDIAKIAGLTIKGDIFEENVAMIDEDHLILIMEGNQQKESEFDPQNSYFLSLEIEDNGKIKKYNL